ncbi:MAG: hypothetical protein IJX57_00310 [Clostridia bacterium]|nr:hypothetical protein [Clostridia bacterium]
MFKLTEGMTTVENEERIVYGIRYNDEYYIEDISADREKTEQMVEMFNRLELSPCHLHDVVEDMLE